MAVSVEHQVVRFGVFELDERARELRKRGVRVRLQEQPFQVLALLLARAGQVVTRDELRQRLWSSSIYVDFDHGLNNAIGRLREALGDSAAAPHFIETLPRLGYRFIYPLAPSTSPVGVPGTETVAETQVVGVSSAPERKPKRTPLVAFGLACALILLGISSWVVERTPAALPVDAPSIAVVPFVSMSSDAENEHFADGLTDELIHTLAVIRGLQVAGATSSFYFKNKNAPTTDIAKALNVDHILEGSVRRAGSRIRVTAQLVDATDGYHRWSETFDRDVSDALAIQQDIARDVADALKVRLLGTDDRRLHERGTRNPDAYRHYLVARAHVSGVFVPRDWRVIKESYAAAIRLDPEFAEAHAGLALYYYNRERLQPEGIQRGIAAAERAIALDPESGDALTARADFEMWRYQFLGDYAAYGRAQNDFRRAIELEPSNALAYYNYARAMQWIAPDLARELFERTAELDPLRYGATGHYAALLSRNGQRDDAMRRVRELYERHPENRTEIAIFVAAIAHDFGELDDALVFTRESLPHSRDWPLLWRLYLSLGDRDNATRVLSEEDSPLARALGDASEHLFAGRHREAFQVLDRHRASFALNRMLDLPTARLASIAGDDEAALAILEQRLPDLVRGTEPINAYNVMPGLDLAYALERAGRSSEARALLSRITVFLDGPAVPRLPLFTYLRARARALALEPEAAQRLLDRAYEEGLRTSWAPCLLPATLLYVDPIAADPAFASLRTSPEYTEWLARIATDNARQLERLRARDGATPTP